MHSKSLDVLVFLLLVPMILISCGMKKAPDKEKEEQSIQPRNGAQVYKTSGLGNEVYSLAGRDVEGTTLVVPSVAVYNYMDRVREALGRESKIDVDEACLDILGIGQTSPIALEIDVKVNQECASLPEGEASHTDPSPLDDNDSWIICGPSDSGGVEGGPGGSAPGEGPDGGNPSANADGDGNSEKPGIGSLQNILCGPAIGSRPAVDPRLVYPDPNKVVGMIAELAPCINGFCPWKLFPIPLDPEDNPTDPIDPSPDDVPELDEDIKSKLPCDMIKSLCEPDLTFIDKNDLLKQSNDEPEGTCDGTCDGVCTKEDGSENAGETCSQGEVGSEDEDWKTCGTTEISEGSVCVEHTKNNQGESEYTVTHGEGVEGNRPPLAEQEAREQEAIDIATRLSDSGDCTVGDIQSNRDENKTSFTVTCK